jgi:surfactin synthase thioesterase subunit
VIFGRDDHYLKTYQPFEEWAKLVRSLRVARVKGDHHFIETEPNVVVPYFNWNGPPL